MTKSRRKPSPRPSAATKPTKATKPAPPPAPTRPKTKTQSKRPARPSARPSAAPAPAEAPPREVPPAPKTPTFETFEAPPAVVRERPAAARPLAAPPPPVSERDLAQASILDLEDAVDALLGGPSAPPPEPDPSPLSERRPEAEPGAGATSDFYLRKWGRQALRHRSEEVDPFGFEPKAEARLRPLIDFLYGAWFRAEVEGASNLPAEGRAIVVANHSGPLPLDGLMLRRAVQRERDRDLRFLAEDYVYHFPFLGTWLSRLGAVRACPENAERLLDDGHVVAVFPEGAKGTGKLYRDRYKLQRFGRGGFVKLALRTGAPIVPCAILGGEETHPMVHRLEALAKPLGVPFLPVTPLFPLLGPLGLVPAPVKWRIAFGAPVDVAGEAGMPAALALEDDAVVSRLADRVRASVQGEVERLVGDRRSVVFG